MFSQDGEKIPDNGDTPKKVSNTCRQFQEGTCPYKTNHTWKECPSNQWSPNKGKLVDAQGVLIVCNFGDVNEFLDMSPDDVEVFMGTKLHDGDSEVSDNNSNHPVIFYSSS